VDSADELAQKLLDHPFTDLRTINSEERRALMDVYHMTPLDFRDYYAGKSKYKVSYVESVIEFSKDSKSVDLLKLAGLDGRGKVVNVSISGQIALVQTGGHVNDLNLIQHSDDLDVVSFSTSWNDVVINCKQVGNKLIVKPLTNYLAVNPWELKTTVILHCIIPESSEPAHKEIKTVKPESLKKSSIQRAQENHTWQEEITYPVHRMGLRVGDTLFAIEGEPDVGQLREEWFGRHDTRTTQLKVCYLTPELAVLRQNELIEVANSFVGRVTYTTTVKNGTYYALVVNEGDPMDLIMQLDTGFWKTRKVAHPTVIERWQDADIVEVVDWTRALLLQANWRMATEVKTKSKAKATVTWQKPPKKESAAK